MEEKLQRKGQACTVGFFHKPRNYSRRALLLSIMRFDDIKSQKLFILLLDRVEGIYQRHRERVVILFSSVWGFIQISYTSRYGFGKDVISAGFVSGL
ncbi:hypothetical protein ACOSQ2_024019 [Xanthoceras sorbifolium]